MSELIWMLPAILCVETLIARIAMPTGPQRLQDDFVHDLRSALTVAKAQTQLLARRKWPPDSPERAHVLGRLAATNEAIDRAIQHIVRFVEESDVGPSVPEDEIVNERR